MSELSGELDAVKALLKDIERVADKLQPNERGLYEELKAKYETSNAVGFADKRCLEVILRNVAVRARGSA